MITIDYHTHHVRCGHALGQIEDYIKAALAKGFAEIGISDHSPLYYMDGNDPQPQSAMAKSELDGYVEEVLKLKEKYIGQIAVRLGLESDYVEGMEDFYGQIFTRYPFDYVIGSVHMVFDEHVYFARRWDKVRDPLPVYAEYYRLLQKSAQTKLFDILGHSTAILAYAPRQTEAQTTALEQMQDEALVAIREADVCVEVNTSGYRKMRTDPFPSARMVGKCVELGIPLTFSSDSHRPDEVAHSRQQVETLFVAKGVTELATFQNRQRIMIPFAVEPAMYV